jgi:hypothetical protein
MVHQLDFFITCICIIHIMHVIEKMIFFQRNCATRGGDGAPAYFLLSFVMICIINMSYLFI